MPKLIAILAAGSIAAAAPFAAPATVLGPHAAECGGAKPAMLVRVTGLKARQGLIRVQSYGGDPGRFFERRSYLERVEAPVPRSGPVEVCMPVPAPGTYAVSVRHDVDASRGKASRADGGGMSGNPDISLMDVIFRRKPSPAQVAVAVKGRTIVPVTMNYVQGTSVGPVAMKDE